jgi:hypothetical protein
LGENEEVELMEVKLHQTVFPSLSVAVCQQYCLLGFPSGWDSGVSQMLVSKMVILTVWLPSGTELTTSFGLTYQGTISL